MIVRDLTITNASGEALVFGDHLKLYEDIELSGLKADVSMAETSGDGASSQKTRLDTRDFEVPFLLHRIVDDKVWFEDKRQDIFRVCNPKKNPMRLDFKTDAEQEYYMHAELTAVPVMPRGFENSNHVWQKVLLQFDAADPYIYAKDETLVELAMWVPAFEFPLEIPEGEGIEMGYRNPTLITNVINDGQEDSGMIIKFKANAGLTNPSLVNLDTYEQLTLKMAMLAGDEVEISTYRGNKYARLIRNNVTTSVFGKIDYLSTFLQLRTGDNVFRYNADTGIDNLEISMRFSKKFVGV